MTLFAFHVHHGLSPNSDRWQSHCEATAGRLGVSFEAHRIVIENRGQHGTEQAARLARYAALGSMCRTNRVQILLTAHHLDDQAETVLLQLLRGSGVSGIGGMDAFNRAPGLLGSADIYLARPLLQCTRIALERYAVANGIEYVHDESNNDTSYTRNALRQYVMPVLRAHFPGFEQRLARGAEHARTADKLLSKLAEEDYAYCSDDGSIDLPRLRSLSVERINNVLRHWFALHDMRMPSTAWLYQMREQILMARNDARIRIENSECEVHRYRARIYLSSRHGAQVSAKPVTFRWQGEGALAFTEFGGQLFFVSANEGIPKDWLQQQELSLRSRSGGEALKTAANRPTRSLKKHYQTLDIPEWERSHLPLLFAGSQLLFAAGVGFNWHAPIGTGGERISLVWKSDAV
jgi:tRNA(Ile)-lysidine synthase